MSRNVQFAPGEFYHIYNRGVDKRIIFSTTRDHYRFLILLYLCNSESPAHIQNNLRTHQDVFTNEISNKEKLVDIVSYCLMPNHFHLLIKERSDAGISKFMQKVSTAYTMYFNRKNDRTGALFQGKFKSTHASDNRYLKYLISYIHLNPVDLVESNWKEIGITNTERVKKFLIDYKYSSYPDFMGKRRAESRILTPDALPRYFETLNSFEAEIHEWLSYSSDTE